MELKKYNWTKEDGDEFVKFLETLKRQDRVEWTKNILNTKLPVLAIKSPDILKLTKEIRKGNYLSFLDLELNNYYENTVINGKLITSIKDFNIMKKYLDIYSKKADNWSTCDLLKFNVKKNEEKFLALSKKYVKSSYPFVRRIGMYILFEFIDDDRYIDEIYKMLNEFEEETEYYVNMMNAWLVCELFIKRKDKTIEFLKCNKLNAFTINKAISKCRDSFRVTKEDKESLLIFRR